MGASCGERGAVDFSINGAQGFARFQNLVEVSEYTVSNGRSCGGRLGWLCLMVFGMVRAPGDPIIKVQPSGNEGFDVFADEVLVAPIRLAAGGAIVADDIETNGSGLRLFGLRVRDPLVVTFAADDFVSITLPPAGATNAAAAPVVQFKLTPANFSTNRWLAQFPDGPAPFHFLVCSMPAAQVWHQRGWLNATPYADPFPLLQDQHAGSPEISCLWNRRPVQLGPARRLEPQRVCRRALIALRDGQHAMLGFPAGLLLYLS